MPRECWAHAPFVPRGGWNLAMPPPHLLRNNKGGEELHTPTLAFGEQPLQAAVHGRGRASSCSTTVLIVTHTQSQRAALDAPGYAEQRGLGSACL